MYSTSESHVFARVERVRRRAAQLLHGHTGAPEPPPDAAGDDEAVALAAGVELRLPRLSTLFALDELAADVVVCLLAAEYDPFMRLLIRALQREQGKPYLEVGTVAELLDLPPARVPELARLINVGGSLRRAALVLVDEITLESPLVSRRVRLHPRIAQHLIGDDALPEGMTLVEPSTDRDEPLVTKQAGERVLERVRWALLHDEQLVVEIAGPSGCGKRHFAETLAGGLGRALLIVDLSSVPRDKLETAIAAGRREAALAGALLCYARWDAHMEQQQMAAPIDETRPPPPQTARVLPPAIVQFLAQLDGTVLLTSRTREPLLELGAKPIVHVDVRFPTPSQRAALLDKALKRHGAGVDPDVDFVALARRYALDPARLAASARAAIELGRERGSVGETPAVNAAELSEGCRRQLRHDLESVAVRITASHRWEDLVIPVDVYYALQEMIAYVRHADRVYEDWGFGRRHGLARGISALFSGPPGTGKTMCAAVMARELDMELFQVDLSRVVSKWIGETEKNLAKVFDEAERSNAIILFDEADSLFARRTEVKSSVDRYANLEVNYLLQRMEGFGGITMLTTNFEDTIDSAFKRRLTFRVRFEKPDADARAALWSKVFPASCALGADVSFERLGLLYEMSGANIRNAAVRAAFLAAAENKPIDMPTLSLAAERECREMGLLVRTEAAHAAAAAAAAGATPDGEQPTGDGDGPKGEPHGSRPKLVPITHPRR
jgi:ATPase family associated with various cellular activities (AAA)/Winged helix domain, variant